MEPKTTEQLAAMEREWLTRHDELRADCEHYGWEPYPLSWFDELLDIAVTRAADDTFLDVGCGIGTKVARAAQRGLKAEGIERVGEYADEAERIGVTVHRCDAWEFRDYGEYGIVYVNCPFRAPALEAGFEEWLHARLRPGAVLIQANDALAPAGWEVIMDDQLHFQGIWVKPFPPGGAM